MEIQKTFNKKIHIVCDSCGLGDISEYRKNLDELYAEFLSRHDSGLVSGDATDIMIQEGMIRNESEINEMVRDHNLDKVTKSILFSKKDYVSQFKVLKNPEPEMGSSVDDMGIGEPIADHLKSSGIRQFYKFQEESIREITYGENVVIEAPTASGKTEAFLVPIVNRIKAESGGIIAVFVYPTKSLSRDQLPKIRKIADAAGISARVFDGDTSQEDRGKILDTPPSILVTNFDVLHYHMWHQTRLASLLSTLEILVVDEAHVYTGIFGSNVHYIIKRLGRLCKNDLQFVAASATLKDAKVFCKDLFGVPMSVIRGSGQKGVIDFAMLFPSLRSQRALMVDLVKQLTDDNHKTMIFSNSHINSELLAMQARKKMVNIKVHRAGLMANYRKLVEKEFKDGSLQAISCTPTLELGIDVGSVDGVISSPVPANRLVQRIGRAARSGQHGFAFLVLGNDPISQYYKNHPDDYFGDVESLYIDPKNPFVERLQVLAMACDRPISRHELQEHDDIIQEHILEGNLIVKDGRFVANFEKVLPILAKYSIRGIGGSVDILLNGRKVGERILPIALEELHKDAIYFLAGTRYRVRDMDYPGKNRARLENIPRNTNYYTRALTEEWPTIQTIHHRRNVFGMEVIFCDLFIRKNVYGYAIVGIGHVITQGKKMMLDTPLTYDLTTKGMVFHAPRPIKEISQAVNEGNTEASGYHATEHVVIESSNMITGGASQDLGGVSMGASGMIFIHDGAVGGSGASRALYDRFEKALERSMKIVMECPCKNDAGCPRCTFSYRCGNNNEFLHKNSALEILERINAGEITAITDPSENDRPLV